MILTSGCFDGLHEGHRALLAAIDSMASSDDGFECIGEVVCVALASDDYIRATKHREPHHLYLARQQALLRSGLVGEVVEHDLPSAAAVIRRLHPKLFVKGIDAAGTLPTDVVRACRDVFAPIVFIDHGETVHTSDAH